MGRPQLSAYLTPILLPDFPTVFMTLAAQGQRKVVTVPLHTVIASSRPLARLEQALRVPAKQMGHAVHSTLQLTSIEEVVTQVISPR